MPDETVKLERDEILFFDGSVMITKWESLKPRADFCRGYSCYFIADMIKVSKFYNSRDELIYHYCDVVEFSADRAGNAYTFTDLLLDVIVMPGGFVKVMDMGELAEAMAKGLISLKQAEVALAACDALLGIIYAGGFGEYIEKFDETIKPFEVLK